MSSAPYKLLGIGIGPFNLGLAALSQGIPEINALFIDKNPSFNWHPGMMIPGSKLQVPFYADLVTLADPQSPFSFLAWLKARKRMFRFAIREDYYIPRSEYNAYCRWVAVQIPSLQFQTEARAIRKLGNLYEVETSGGVYQAEHIVLGIGTVPAVPDFITLRPPEIFHSADYLNYRESLLRQPQITLVGSGQTKFDQLVAQNRIKTIKKGRKIYVAVGEVERYFESK